MGILIVQCGEGMGDLCFHDFLRALDIEAVI